MIQLIHAHQHSGRIGTAACHAGTHRHALLHADLHAALQPRVFQKHFGRLVGRVFFVGSHKAAGQFQLNVGCLLQRDTLIKGNGLHDHIQIMVAIFKKAHDVQRQIQLGRGQNRYLFHENLSFFLQSELALQVFVIVGTAKICAHLSLSPGTFRGSRSSECSPLAEF